MNRHPIIDVVDQLDGDQTRLAIDLLSELLDALVMHLHRIEPVQPSAEWRDPPWLDPPDDSHNQ